MIVKRLLAIDPGPEQSACVIFDCVTQRIVDCEIVENLAMVWNVKNRDVDAVAIEMVACYGMAVGVDVFETVYWIGRFAQAWDNDAKLHRVTRMQVKMAICHDSRAKDTNIRQAILDRYGGKSAIGTKKQPGPLYGVKSHIWAALAVALTART